MENDIETLLNQLLGIMTNARAPLAAMLQKGIDREVVDRNIKYLNISLPEDVYALFGWCNGTDITKNNTFDQTWFFPLGSFISIENAVGNYEYNAGKDDYWLEQMFMVFESGGGELYLIDCDVTSPTYRMIYKHWVGAVDYEGIITMYDSLHALLKSVIECFETGAYFFNEEGSLQFDFDKELAISRKNNPNSKLWKIYGN